MQPDDVSCTSVEAQCDVCADRRLISTNDGCLPRRSTDGRELYYREKQRIMAGRDLSSMGEPFDAVKARRRRKWIVAFSLPGYVALITFAMMAALQASHLDPPEWTTLIFFPFAVVGVFFWGTGPGFFLINLFMLLRDPWRRGRSRRERIGLTVLVLGSPVAWFIANLISDAYHLLR